MVENNELLRKEFHKAVAIVINIKQTNKEKSPQTQTQKSNKTTTKRVKSNFPYRSAVTITVNEAI